MRRLIRLKLAFAVVAVTSISAVAQQQHDLVGSYLVRSEWGGTEITLKKNGTFTSASSNCTSVVTEHGRYSVSNNIVRLKATKQTWRNYGEKDIDVTRGKARKKHIGDEPFKPETLDLHVIRWGERIYLSHPDSFGFFIKAINLGFEPRLVDGYRANYYAPFLRIGDEKKPVTGAPSLPEEFLRHILAAPIEATVVEVKVEGNHKIVTIDRGSADGLKLEMPLVPTTPISFFDFHLITSITEHSAQVEVYANINVGDKLTTRIPDLKQLF